MWQQEMTERLQKRLVGIIFCGAIPLVLFLLAIKNGYLVYAINDDTGMRSMAIGAYSGTPDAHLNYPSYFWGVIISCLYRMFPALDWYGILLWGTPIIGLCLLMNQLQSKMQGIRNKILCSLLALVTILLVIGGELMRMQWTVSAALCGISGGLIYYLGGGRLAPNLQAMFLFCCSLMIRKHSFYMTLVLFALLFIYRETDGLWDYEKNRIRVEQIKKIAKKNTWIFAVVLFAVLTSISTDLAYSSDEWISYKIYANKRALLYDYQQIPEWETAKDFYEANGYSEQTVEMLDAYLIGFLDDIGAEDFAKITDYARLQKGAMLGRIKDTFLSLSRLLDNSYTGRIYLLAAGTILLLVYKVSRKAWKDAGLLAAAALACSAMIFLLEMRGKLPDRVLVIILLLQFSAVLAVLCRSVATNSVGLLFVGKKQKNLWILPVLCVAAVLLMEEKAEYHDMIELRDSNAEARLVDEYFISHSENLYVLAESREKASTRNFAFVNAYPTPCNTISTIGWGIRNPLWYDKLTLFGASSPTEALFKDNVYLCTYSQERMELIVKYLRSEGKRVETECVDIFAFSEGQAPLFVYKICLV